MVFLAPENDFFIKLIKGLVKRSYLLILLNFIPIFLSGLLLEGLLGNLAWALILNSTLFMGFFTIHNTKAMYRNAPFLFNDFHLATEAMDMLSQAFYPDINTILIFVGFIIATFLITRLIKRKQINLKSRLILIVMVFILSGGLYKGLYKSDRLYCFLPLEGNTFNSLDHFNSKGFNYSFIYNIKNSFIKPPENYSREKIKRIDEVDRSEKIKELRGKDKPNIIWIMGEAFTDISERPCFSFAEGYDPNANFKRLKNEAVLSGKIVTPSFGGGTGDTEFDVLTGAMTQDITPEGSIAFHSINKNINALPRFLREIGYDTRAFHPGYEWFYRRNDIYPRLGFDESFFLEDIGKPDIRGEYVSQRQFTDLFMERFEKSLADGDLPIFDYGLDIQNHGPYYYDKYEEFYPFECSYPLENDDKAMFGAYFFGTRDIDIMLGELYEMINSKAEPIIMVFYGDHLPTFGSEPDGYELIGMDLNWDSIDGEIEYYATPFIILTNESGKAYLNKENLELEDEPVISSNYLAGAVLDMLDYTEGNRFFSYNSDLRKKLPIISRHYVFDGKTPYEIDKLPEDIEGIYGGYRKYMYYKVNE